MTTAIVLGNGTSRLALDLNNCKKAAAVYGCNALYREFTPDVLVATDTPIATEIQNSGYAKSNRFYTRRPINGSGALAIPKDWKGWSSGPIAAALACADGHTRIYLAGFDLGGINGMFNNVYAGTEFYKKSNDRATFSGNWIDQLINVSLQFPDCKFIRVIGEHTAPVPKFSNRNFLEVSIDQLSLLINNGGEL